LALRSHVFEIFGLEVARSDRVEYTVTYKEGRDCLVQSPGYVGNERKEDRTNDQRGTQEKKQYKKTKYDATRATEGKERVSRSPQRERMLWDRERKGNEEGDKRAEINKIGRA